MRDNQTSASESRNGSGRGQSPSFGRDGAMPAVDVQGRVFELFGHSSALLLNYR
jgi:hypothetical protein